MSAETLEIINGISQVLSNTYDGALTEDGEPVEIGLRREEGNPLLDVRIMDGFSACIKGERLHIKYHSEIPLKEVHESQFESDTESYIENIKSYIQKEFKKVTGNSLTLSDPSEVDVVVEYASRIRTIVRAHKCYKIGSMEAEANDLGDSEDRLDKSIRSWLELGGTDARPDNDSRSK